MENKGCLKNATTEQNIVVNYSINLPKNVSIEKIRIKKSITKKLILRKSLTTIRELRASTYSPINEWCRRLMGGVANAYVSHIRCKIICDCHNNRTKL